MIGIDKINFYTPNIYMDLVDLANHRNIEPTKFTIGIGQSKMAVPPITQDTVSMGANAAYPIISDEDKQLIDLIVVGTESGIDESKSTASFIHQLLGIHPFAKSIEVKQACYGATAGLMTALDFVTLNPEKKALVIGSDISRYGLKTSGEVTQGAGAVAMIISSSPRILVINRDSVAMTENIFDFWRPNYYDTAIVDGKFSNEAYMSFFKKLWEEYSDRHHSHFADFEAFCFHLPYSKMGKKALLPLLENEEDTTKERLLANYELSTHYTKMIGNIYTGSLYLSLISLLDQGTQLTAGQKIGFFSYGSGAVGEMFSGTLVEGFRQHLLTDDLTTLVNNRTALTINEYETIFNERLPKADGVHPIHSDYDQQSRFILSEINEHQRRYTQQF